MQETAENRIKRLKMRSWRRGTKEMDMVLGPYADAELSNLDASLLDKYEALLEENDQDLYVWFSGQKAGPQEHAEIFGILRSFHNLT